jgi:hypothetical protein
MTRQDVDVQQDDQREGRRGAMGALLMRAFHLGAGSEGRKPSNAAWSGRKISCREWIAAGLHPDSFWKQTPRSFVAVMDGAARRQKREFDLMVSGAWHAEAFARTKQLKQLSDYTGTKPVRKAQTPDEMLAALQMMKAGGAPLSIRELN